MANAPAGRITAVLQAFAVGEALGRATEHYEPDEIPDIYEDAVTDFVEPVRLFDEEEWAEGETGPGTALLLALAPPAPESDIDRLGADALDRLAGGVTLGLRRSLADLLTRPPAPERAAIAAVLRAALDGHPPREALGYGAEAARAAGANTLAAHILEAGGIAQASGGRHAGTALRDRFPPGGGVEAQVPFILGIVYATQGARRAILEAVNQGGHAPETAAIAGALAAAITPGSLPPAWAAEVERRNGLDLAAVAARYAAAYDTNQGER